MRFGEAIHSCFSKFATFQGRAPRSEFWWFMLILWLLTFVIAFVVSFFVSDSLENLSAGSALLLGPLFAGGLFLWLASLSVTIRRLHDSDKSGWWYWISLVPYAGVLVLLIFMLLPGTNGDNRFGPKPVS